MSTKDYAVKVLNSMTEEQMLDFLRLFADDNTLALAESDFIAKNPNRKHYDSLGEILAEIDAEDFEPARTVI